MRKKLVYICSPCRGNMEKNIQKAQGYCREAADLWPDVIPIAPHVYFTQFYDETIPEERAASMDMGLALLDICDEIWVYGLNNPSEGMKREIEYAKKNGIPLRDAADLYRIRQQANEKPIGELLLYFTSEKEGHATAQLSCPLLEATAKWLRRNRGNDFIISDWRDGNPEPNMPDGASL